MIHCDLKPANILLDTERNARIVDFGQAHKRGEESIALSTFWYMPPEQAILPFDGHMPLPDVRWDVYAMGATFYELLTGRLPRQTETGEKALDECDNIVERIEAYRKLVSETSLVPIRQLNPAVSFDVATIIEHCLEVRSERRYQTPSEVLADLRNSRNHMPLMAHPHDGWDQFQRFAARNGILVAAATVVLVLSSLYIISLQRAQEATVRNLAAVQHQRGISLLSESSMDAAVWLAAAYRNDPTSDVYRWSAAMAMQRSPRLQWFMPVVQGTARDLITTPEFDKVLVVADIFSSTPFQLHDTRQLKTLATDYDRESNLKVARSGDARVLATLRVHIDKSATVRLFNTFEGRERCPPLRFDQPVDYLHLSYDGRTLATMQPDLVSLFDTTTGQRIGEPTAIKWPFVGPVGHEAWGFSDDGKRFHVVTGEEAVSIEVGGPAQRTELGGLAPVGFTALTSQGLFAYGRADGKVLIRHLGKDDERILDVGGSGPFYLMFNDAGTRLLVRTGDGAVQLFDAEKGTPVSSRIHLGKDLTWALLNPAGTRFFVCDVAGNEAIYADDGTALCRDLVHDQGVRQVGFDEPSGGLFTLSGSGLLRMLDERGRLEWSLHDVSYCVVSNDTRFLTSSADGLRLWERPASALVATATWEDPTMFWHDQSLWVASATGLQRYAPNGRTVGDIIRLDGTVQAAAAGLLALQNDKGIRIMDTAGSLQLDVPSAEKVFDISLSPDGERLVVHSLAGYEVWDVASRRRIRQEPLKHAQFAFWNGSSTHYLTCNVRMEVQIWTRDGEPIAPPFKPDRSAIRFALSHAGDVAYLGSGDGTVVRYTPQGERLPGLIGHQAAVTGVSIDASNRLITWSRDATARVWDGQTLQPLTPALQCRSWITSTVTSRDGRWLATLETTGTWRLWDARTGDPLSAEFNGPDRATALVFDAATGCVASLASGGQLRIWNLQLDTQLRPPAFQAQVTRRTGLLLDAKGLVRPASPAELRRAELVH